MNKLILGNFYLSLLLSGLSFLASCFFNKNAYYFLIIGTIFVFSGVCNILSFMATQMDDLKSLQFFSFFTLSSLVGVEELFTLAVNNYDIEVITKPSAILYLKNIACICAGIVALISSLFIFRIRDLPL
jgi:uncharacterized membrane protein HdeD (DUF308 family)